jgi:hypothetical protein
MSASASSEEDVQFLDWLAEIERAGGFDALPEGSVAEPVLAASAAVVRETWTRVHDPPRATLLPSRAPPA